MTAATWLCHQFLTLLHIDDAEAGMVRLIT